MSKKKLRQKLKDSDNRNKKLFASIVELRNRLAEKEVELHDTRLLLREWEDSPEPEPTPIPELVALYEPEPVLPEEPPVGTVLLQTDENGVPLPGARAIKRTEEGWIGATDWPETWVEVVDWAPFVIIYSPAQAVPLTNADIETIVFPEAGEQA